VVPPMPTSTVPALAHIFRSEGFAGVYSGLGPTLIMAVPATVLYFSAYDDLKGRLTPSVGADVAPPLAGMTARFLASAATSPFELVRTIMQSGESSSGAPMTTMGSFRVLLKDGGVPALWRGLEPTLWRDVPFSAIYWFAFERAKRAMEGDNITHTNPLTAAARSFVAGAGAGMLAATITTPMDVVKTRRQIFSALGTDIGSGPSNGNGSTPSVMRAIFREEGLQGLFRGLRPRILKIAPACAIMISSYEGGKRAFGLVD
jgi:solute carrier family 25, member 39/40